MLLLAIFIKSSATSVYHFDWLACSSHNEFSPLSGVDREGPMYLSFVGRIVADSRCFHGSTLSSGLEEMRVEDLCHCFK